MANLEVKVTVVKGELNKLKTELNEIQKIAKDIKIDVSNVNKAKSSFEGMAKSQIAAQAKVDAARITGEKRVEAQIIASAGRIVQAEQAAAAKREKQIIESAGKIVQEEQKAAAKREVANINADAKIAKANIDAHAKIQAAMLRTENSSQRLSNVWKNMFSQFSLSNMVSSGVTRAISAMRSYFNEALNEMKELDTALTHYRQVTGADATTANALGAKAYSVGSQYGTSASDYAESVATYARAGYKDASDALAELSLKTVIVGQTTQEIADQFLLTMDAAYGYKGSVEELSRVLDGASAIDSTYATTIEKIAAGLGLVAPLAQQVHVEEDELTAAIGTITAVTQRSGAESARALRSLFLNIIGDTTTEIEDGVTATEESVASLQTVLNKYAKSAVDAAKASGEVINPMEAIGALAESMKQGYLNEAELMDLLSGLGGKLRVSQLVALVSHWDMYVKMIDTYNNSMGSADKKTTVYLDSWEAKVNILKNTWTEFVAKSLDTDTFKGFLDGVTKILKVIGNLKNAIVLLGGAFAGIKMIFKAKDLANLAQSYRVVSAEAYNAGKTIEGAFNSQQAVSASMKSSILGWSGIAIGAITAVYSAYEMWHEHQMSNLREETDAAIEKARTEQSEARNVADAYQTYFNAQNAFNEGKIATETYETAVRNLAEALGYEADEIDRVKYNLKELSIEQLKEAKRETESAIRAAKAEAKTGLGKFSLRVLGSNPIFDAYNATDQNGVLLAEDVRLEKAIEKYKEYAQIRDNYLKGDARIAEDEYQKAVKILGGVPQALVDLIEQQGILDEIIGNIADISTGDIDSQSVDELNDSLGTTSEAAESAAKSFGGLADAIKDAKSALVDYQTATQTEKDDTYTAYADAWKTGFEDFEKGMKNSNAVNAALDLYFTPEQMLRLRDRGIDAAEVLFGDFWQDIFTYINDSGETAFINDDAGSNFIYALYDKFADEAGNIKAANGDIVASFQEVDGELSVQVDSFEALAQALGEVHDTSVDPDVLAAVFEALGMYSSEIQMLPEDIKATANALQAVNDVGEIDLEKLIQGKIDEGATTQEIIQLRDAVLDLHNEANSPVKVNIQEGESVSDVKNRVDDLIKNRDELTENAADITITADTKKADEAMDRTLRKEKEIEENSPVVTITADDIQFQKAMQEIQRRQYKVQVSINAVNNVGSIGTGEGGMRILADTQASGTNNAPGGLTLVNERGAEIIAEDGYARIAGNGKPTLTWLQSGAQVFNATETRAILGGVNPGYLFDGIGAYAGGKASGIKRYQTKDASSTGTSTGTSSTSSTGTSTTKGTTTKGKSSSSKDDTKLEKLKEVVELRKSELDLLEAQERPVREQIEKQRQIYDALGDQIKYMKQAGYSQTEINKLLTEQYKIQKEINDLNQGLLDDLEKAIENRIDEINEKRDAEIEKLDAEIDKLKEAHEIEEDTLAVEEAREKLRNARAERKIRTYNSKTGQWEWVADAKAVQDAEEELKDAKYEARLAALERKKEAVTEKYLQKTDKWQKVLESLEEPVQSIGSALKKIANGATKDQKSTLKALNKLLKPLGYSIDLSKLYDSGGVLQGMGGIKATQDDEIVLPPDITKKMLQPIQTAVLGNRLDELRYLYGVTGGNTAGISNTSNSYGNTYNGNMYTFGNVTLTETQARNTTIYEFVQASRGLRAFSGR